MKVRSNSGFTLLEVIIAVAIVAIMAGALAPAIVHEINDARNRSTLAELELIGDSLRDFYADTGRFPTEGEGLSALVTDPGVANWRGPYARGAFQELQTALANDGFGRAYTYDLAPTLASGSATGAILVSGGVDHSIDLGALNGTWNLATDCDDLFRTIASSDLDREIDEEVQAELGALAEASRNHYRTTNTFPGDLGDLSSAYIDPGYQGAALRDPWGEDYLLDTAGTPAILTLYSRGPDGQDDDAGDDDLFVTVSSEALDNEGGGSEMTQEEKILYLQSVIDANPAVDLDRTWRNEVRPDLGLSAFWNVDDWGNTYGTNSATRTVYSCGPDGSGSSTGDNIPTGVGP